jgi:hypothetical protein
MIDHAAEVVEDFTHMDTTINKFCPCRIYVRHDEMECPR